MDFFFIGQRREEWATKSDSLRIEYDTDGFTAYVMYNGIYPEEMKQFGDDQPIKFAFSEYKDIGFFCIRFGKMPWAEFPFTPKIYREFPDFGDLGKEEGYAFKVFLIESNTGTLKSMRILGLGHDFSMYIKSWAESQRNISMEAPQQYMKKYESVVRECHEKYSVEQLVLMARVKYDHGTTEKEK